jgi:hypothetical protein
MREKSISGQRIEEVHGYFKGTCADCLERKSNKIKGSNSGLFLSAEKKTPCSKPEESKKNAKE